MDSRSADPSRSRLGRRRCSRRLFRFHQPGLPVCPHVPRNGPQRELPGPPAGICQRRRRSPLRNPRISPSVACALASDRFPRRGRCRYLGHVTRWLEQSSTPAALERPAGRAGNQRRDHTTWFYGRACGGGAGRRHGRAGRPSAGPVPSRDPDRFPRYAGGFRTRRQNSGSVLLPCVRTAERVAKTPLWHSDDLAGRCPVARQRPGQPADDRARCRSRGDLGRAGFFLMLALMAERFGNGRAR
jgi:hypothetical protein